MQVEMREGQTYTLPEEGTFRDRGGTVVLTVRRGWTQGGYTGGFLAHGKLLTHLDGDSLAVRTLYADTLPAACAEARALVLRELADHAARVADLIRQLAEEGRTDGCCTTAPTEKRPGVDGQDGDLRQAVVAVDPDAGDAV